MLYNNDDELFSLMKTKLYTAVVGDILDKMHRFNQFLPYQVKPIRDDMIVAGRAMPVLEADIPGFEVEGAHSPLLNKNFGLMLEALDAVRKNEVYICSGSSLRYALVGEIMCTRMKYLEGAGAVVNGLHRDTQGILDINFPCFSYGSYAQDQAPRGKVLDYRVPIDFSGIPVRPGDIVFGDRDGVLILPQELEAEVIERSYEKAVSENIVGKAIREGLSAVESWNKYQIM